MIKRVRYNNNEHITWEEKMADWFKTKKEANQELKRRQQKNVLSSSDEVFKWNHTKRKKPFFVGSFFEWINK